MVEEDIKFVDYSKPFHNDTPSSIIVGEEE